MLRLIIDGGRFSDIDGFFDEAGKVMTKDFEGNTGHNFSAFHDLLRGGFGVYEYGEQAEFVWINSEKSRNDLGYEETAKYYEKLLRKCHPSNRERISEKLEQAKNHEGKTLFDIIVDEFNDKSDAYDHILTLE